jgi:hypothetical protein
MKGIVRADNLHEENQMVKLSCVEG